MSRNQNQGQITSTTSTLPVISNIPAGMRLALVPANQTGAQNLGAPSARTLRNRRRRAAARQNRQVDGGLGAGTSNQQLNVLMARAGMVSSTPATMKSTAPTNSARPSTANGARLKGRESFFKFMNPNTDGSFSPVVIELNPLKFLWLSTYAKNYEQFFFHSLVFTWHPSFASANGTIAMAIDNDATDDPPKSFQSLIKNYFSEAGLVCAPFGFRYDGKIGTGGGRFFIESKGTNKLQTTQGCLVIASESVGEQSAYGIRKDTPLGYVFVDYDCEFFLPQPSE